MRWNNNKRAIEGRCLGDNEGALRRLAIMLLTLCLTACGSLRVEGGAVSLLRGGSGESRIIEPEDTSDYMAWRFTAKVDLGCMGSGMVGCSVRGGGLYLGGWVIRDPESEVWRESVDYRPVNKPYVAVISMSRHDMDMVDAMRDDESIVLRVRLIRGPPAWVNIDSNEVVVQAKDILGRRAAR